MDPETRRREQLDTIADVLPERAAEIQQAYVQFIADRTIRQRGALLDRLSTAARQEVHLDPHTPDFWAPILSRMARETGRGTAHFAGMDALSAMVARHEGYVGREADRRRDAQEVYVNVQLRNERPDDGDNVEVSID